MSNKVYPNQDDISGKGREIPTYEEITAMIEDARQKFKSAKEKLPYLKSVLDDTLIEWRDCLVFDDTQKKADELEKKIRSLETQIEALKEIDPERELIAFLKRNPKLGDACVRFEQQQLAALKEIEAEKQAAIKVFQETRKPFLEATRALAFTNCKAQRVLGKLNSLCNFTGRNVSYNSLYELVFFQMVDPSEKFIREWEGGCIDTVFPEPGKTIHSENVEPQQPIQSENNENAKSEVTENV